MNECPFCSPPAERIVDKEGPCFAIRDLYPVSRGHTLIIPHRHIESFRALSEEEWLAAHRLACRIAEALQREDPEIVAFNFGINDGRAAGQSIPHVHIHLIPRRTGDVWRPRGGVRGVIPHKRDYP